MKPTIYLLAGIVLAVFTGTAFTPNTDAFLGNAGIETAWWISAIFIYLAIWMSLRSPITIFRMVLLTIASCVAAELFNSVLVEGALRYIDEFVIKLPVGCDAHCAEERLEYVEHLLLTLLLALTMYLLTIFAASSLSCGTLRKIGNRIFQRIT